MGLKDFDILRKEKPFSEYEYKGVKFFCKEELAQWSIKKKIHSKS